MGDATMANRVKIPRDLGEHGRRLVRQVVREVTDASMVLTSTEEFWLHSAAEMTDRAAELREELRGAPKMVRGSQGQDVINPLISEWWALHLAINLTLARIKLPDADAGDGLQDIVKINRANPQRAGAHKRWRGAGA
jgi:hypothetical protein